MVHLINNQKDNILTDITVKRYIQIYVIIILCLEKSDCTKLRPPRCRRTFVELEVLDSQLNPVTHFGISAFHYAMQYPITYNIYFTEIDNTLYGKEHFVFLLKRLV